MVKGPAQSRDKITSHLIGFHFRGSLYVMYPAMMFTSGVLFILSVIPLRSQLEKCTII